MIGTKSLGLEPLQPSQLVQATFDGEKLEIDIPYRGSIKPTAYLTYQPAALVIEMPPGNPEQNYRVASAPGARLKLNDLTPDRASMKAELPYRVPPSSLTVRSEGGRMHIELKTNYDYEDNFRVTPNTLWKRREFTRDGRYLLWNEVSFDPKAGGASLDLGLAKDRLDTRERPSSVAQRNSALMAVNGGYFAGGGGALGLIYRDGKIQMPHVSHRPPRTGFGLTSSGKILMDRILVNQGQVMTTSGESWNDLRVAMGAGPRLIQQGRIAMTTDEEELGPRGNDITRRAARTALAVNRDGRVSIITAVGYHDLHREGLKLDELARELSARGVKDAMNFDGGSSTSMSLGGYVVSNGASAPRIEKEVATSVLVKDSRPAHFPATMTAKADSSRYPADGTSQIEITADVRDNYGQPVSDGAVVRVFGDHCALSKDGYRVSNGQVIFQATTTSSVGDGKIRLECGAARSEVSFSLDPGPAERLSYKLVPGLNGPDYQEVSVVLFSCDRQGNPVGNVPLTLSGSPLSTGDDNGLTGKNGRKTFTVKLPLAGGRLSVRCQGLPGLEIPIGKAEAGKTPTVPARPELKPQGEPSPTPAEPSPVPEP